MMDICILLNTYPVLTPLTVLTDLTNCCHWLDDVEFGSFLLDIAYKLQ